LLVGFLASALVAASAWDREGGRRPTRVRGSEVYVIVRILTGETKDGLKAADNIHPLAVLFKREGCDFCEKLP
jgi:hypothetical protein